MSWLLFLQIEIILLTLGLVVSFVVSMHQNAKDNSFVKKISASVELLNNSIAEKKEEH